MYTLGDSYMCVDACSSLRWEQMGHYCCFLARMMLGLGGDKRLSMFKMTPLSKAPLRAKCISSLLTNL